jgi:hypothetical protein
MRVSLAVLGVLVLLGGSGLGAQSFQAFGARPAVTLISPDFADAELTGLLATLDRQLAARPAAGSAEESTATVLWQFARRLQSGRLSKSGAPGPRPPGSTGEGTSQRRLDR